ncbi:MAG: flavodoxin domain-containing protein [Candidatus Aegiribacteria sp.]|nr:flavodoxin domain-containing protein [Candidatus Aegiribacteria sp.]
MKNLIVFATKYGSVTNAAKLLAGELQGTTDLVRLGHDDLPTLDEYDSVVVGGSIYIGNIQKEVKEFCWDFKAELLEKKLGLFICAGEKNEEKRMDAIRKNFPTELIDNSTATGWFGHEVHFEKASFMDRTAIRLIMGVKKSFSDLKKENIAEFAAKMNIGAGPNI